MRKKYFVKNNSKIKFQLMEFPSILFQFENFSSQLIKKNFFQSLQFLLMEFRFDGGDSVVYQRRSMEKKMLHSDCCWDQYWAQNWMNAALQNYSFGFKKFSICKYIYGSSQVPQKKCTHVHRKNKWSSL